MTAKQFQDDWQFSVPSLLTLSLELISPKSSGGLCLAAASTNVRDMTGRMSPELTDQSVCVSKGSVFPYPPTKTTQIPAISLLLRIKDTKVLSTKNTIVIEPDVQPGLHSEGRNCRAWCQTLCVPSHHRSSP